MKFKEQGFSWVPAGMEYIKRGGAAIYIRYGRFPRGKITLHDSESRCMRITCPDRELLIISNMNQVHAYRPTAGTYDELVVLSPFYEKAAKDLHYRFLMSNYTTYIGKEGLSSRIRRSGGHKGGTQIIADSGGYQISQGKIDYIDPQFLIKWYNDNVDLGMVLDIPSRVSGVKNSQRLARIQAANTKVLMDNKRDDLELINIYHGGSEAELAAYRDLTDRPDINRLAIGGGYYGTVLGSIERVVRILMDSRKYEQYHLLGVQNILQTLPMMKMAIEGLAPLITSDSTTHIQNAVSKGYYFHGSMTDPPRYINIGQRGTSPYIPSPYSTLSCTCAVCSAIKYSDVLSILTGDAVDQMLMYHNLFETQRYMLSMYEALERSDHKQTKELLVSQFVTGKKTKRVGITEMMKSFDFIEVAKNEGIKQAQKKYAYYLQSSAAGRSTKTLFQAAELASTSVAQAHMESYAQRYELSQGVHGKKTITKGKVYKIKSVKSSSSKRKGRTTKKGKKRADLTKPA